MITGKQLEETISKFASVNRVDMPASGKGLAYIRLKASNADKLASLIQREGGLEVHSSVLKLEAVCGEEERVYWCIAKNLNHQNTLADTFIPLINKHGHKRSAKSLKRSHQKQKIEPKKRKSGQLEVSSGKSKRVKTVNSEKLLGGLMNNLGEFKL